MAIPDTVEIVQFSSFQLCQLTEMKYERQKGEYFYVHDFHDHQDYERFKRNVALSTYDSVSLLSVLMRVST